MIKLRRSVHLLEVTDMQRRLILHILWEGRDLRWTRYSWTNMAAEVGNIIGVPETTARDNLRHLANIGWLRRSTDADGRSFIQLTPRFWAECELMVERMEVRRALGSAQWRKLNGDERLADQLYKLAAEMPQRTFKERVRAAVKKLTDDAVSRHPSRTAFRPPTTDPRPLRTDSRPEDAS